MCCQGSRHAGWGRKGQITNNPADIDAIVKRAWKAVYDGVEGCIQIAVDVFLEKFSKYTLKANPFQAPAITGERVFESFAKTAESAGALDGWNPKELALLSKEVCNHIAEMLNQIEAGAPWPKSATHAKAVYLQKEGAEVGQVMSYRALTITAPLYRAWATMRLADLKEWIESWALPEMYAGVPGRGAVDAWREAFTLVELLKLDGTH